MSANTPLRLGIIGCGRILPAHLGALRRLKERGAAQFTITALCARRLEDAASFRLRGEGPPPRAPVLAANDPLSAPHVYVSDLQPDPLPELYTDYSALIEADVADAFLVTTSLETHHDIAVKALRRGRHVLMEKPLAVTVRAARQMVDAAAQGGAVLATAENARYLPEARAAHWAVQSGLLGTPQMVLGGGIGAGVWSPNYVIAETPWRHDRLRAGGGPVIDLGVHRFDVLRYVCGPISAVSGLVRTFEPQRTLRDLAGGEHGTFPSDVEDAAFAQLSFASGAIGQYVFSWGAHGEQFHIPGGRLIWGSRGSLHGRRLTLDGAASGAEPGGRGAALQGGRPGGPRPAVPLRPGGRPLRDGPGAAGLLPGHRGGAADGGQRGRRAARPGNRLRRDRVLGRRAAPLGGGRGARRGGGLPGADRPPPRPALVRVRV